MLKCKHCDTPLRDQQKDFCCNGCAAAYKIITDLNLEQYYQYYSQLLGKAPPVVDKLDNQIDYLSYVYQSKDGYGIHLMVEGLHCGACVWLIENLMRQQKNIITARVNLTTRRIQLEWNGKEEDISTHIRVIQEAGYRLIPYDPFLYEEKEKYEQRQILKQLTVAGFGFIQSMMVVIAIWAGHWNTEESIYTQHIFHIVTALISIPCIIYSARPFIKSAYTAIINGRSNMDVAIVLATSFTLILSIMETINNQSYTYFDSVLMLIFFLLIGRYVDLKVRYRISTQAKQLLFSQPQTAIVEQGNKLVLMNVSKITIGDIIRVAIGEKIALDGMIIDGETTIDASILTGESLPCPAKTGDYVHAGSLNVSNPIRIKITKCSNTSLISEMLKLIDIASKQKNKFTIIADKVALFYTPLVVLLSIGTFIYWHIIAQIGVHQSMVNAIAILLITCPCALALAVPAVYIIAASKLMQNGILLKNPDALEKLTKVNLLYLDKTGTITYGRPEWVNFQTFSKAEQELLSAITAYSKHPLCISVQKHLHEFDITKEITNVTEHAGQGLEVIYNNHRVLLGNRKFVGMLKATDDEYMEMWLSIDGACKRLIFKDLIRIEAKYVIKNLYNKGLKASLLSGDRKKIVAATAISAGIKHQYGELSPQQKYHLVEEAQTDGNKVLMLGDGLNDSAAMKLAYCSMSPSNGMDITQNIADIVYPGSLHAIIYTLSIANHSQKLVWQNISISLLYNTIMVPVAMCGYITPVAAALFMSISSITVVANAMRLGNGIKINDHLLIKTPLNQVPQ